MRDRTINRTRSSLRSHAARAGSLVAIAILTTAAAPAPAPLPPAPKAAAPPAGAMPNFSNMTTYWFGVLSRGPAWTPERSARTDSLQRAHLANIRRMWEGGWLLAAGPFGDDGPLRGVFVFRDDSIAVLRREADKDPTIHSGRLRLELTRWFAPKGIGERYAARAKQVRPPRDSMVVVQLAFLKRGDVAVKETDAELQDLQLAHVSNIFRLLGTGVMPLGGPLIGEGADRGLCVFTLPADSVKSRLADDPFVSRGYLKVEQHPWWVAEGVLP